MNSVSTLAWPQWDVFIAHCNEDKEMASALFHAAALQSHTRFLDAQAIPVGSDWDEVLQKAQNDSLITVALISAATRKSHFTREEIHTAIKMVRRNPCRHKLIPVYLERMPQEPEDFLYGLGLIQGIELTKTGGIEGTANFLSDAINQMKSSSVTSLWAEGQHRHVLLDYPLGPLVEPNLIKRSIIDIYSRLIPLSERRLVVTEANNFRLEADPGTPYTIRLHKIASADSIPDFTFWLEVFDYARLQGPRMLAALLLVVPDDLWDNQAKVDRHNLLKVLRTANI